MISKVINYEALFFWILIEFGQQLPYLYFKPSANSCIALMQSVTIKRAGAKQTKRDVDHL
ncbi:hypothetical protein ASF92_16710 [Pedobacter sp. Leaf176]|nr:hypothetical protein ASF92_16710 [Pedobacter sp. Leaf176]